MILRCPEMHQHPKPAEPALIEKLNQRIATAQFRNHAGVPVAEKPEGGLVREDGRRLYLVRHEIPIMLVDESIAL